MLYINSNIIDKIDAFFSKIFAKLQDTVTLTTLSALIAGIIIGFVLCSTIYGLSLLRSIKKTNKQISQEISYDEVLNPIVKNIQNAYIEESEGLGIKNRFEILGYKIVDVANQIALIYYPNSKYPLAELTVEELIYLIRYISNRLEEVFDKPVLRMLKKVSLKKGFELLEAKKRVDDAKLMKVVKKTNVRKVTKAAKSILNIFNPIKWAKKLIVGSTVNVATNYMGKIVIEIVAEEVAKTYSKTIFNQEKNQNDLELDLMIQELNEEVNDEGSQK